MLCFDSEVDLHSLKLGNQAFSSNPEARALSAWYILLKPLGGKNNCRNRVGLVRSYYAHLLIRKQRVPAHGEITHTQESDSDSNVSIGNGKENHHPKREFAQIDNLSLIFQLLSNVGDVFFCFLFFFSGVPFSRTVSKFTKTKRKS